MKEIKIELDFLFGPIIKDVYSEDKKELITGVNVIDNNEEINRLNNEISNLYSSFYEFNKIGSLCSFNKEKLILCKNQLLISIKRLINMLNSINDGTYTVIDLATNKIEKITQ